MIVLSRLSPLGPLVLFALLWQALPTLGLVDPSFLPSPVAIGRALLGLMHGWSFYTDLGATMMRSLGGLLCGALVGIPIGALMALSTRAEQFFNPIIKSTYSLPKTSLVPLLILWFGIGSTTDVVAVMLATILPLIIYTYHGVQATPSNLVWSAKAMGASPRGLFWHVYLPSALHGILTGMRIALGFALVVAIAAEMIASKTGVGKLIFLYGENGAYDFMFAVVAVVVAAACITDAGFVALSGRLLRWQEPQHQDAR
jgi:ABC-type nitrate/sulfonate/bicarbonate transport system permease component